MPMLEKLMEYGLAGAVMGLVMYLVVKPLVGSLIQGLESSQAEIAAQREERTAMCRQHQEYHDRSLTILAGLQSSVDALVRRANGDS
jgi:hypothetical protein